MIIRSNKINVQFLVNTYTVLLVPRLLINKHFSNTMFCQRQADTAKTFSLCQFLFRLHKYVTNVGMTANSNLFLEDYHMNFCQYLNKFVGAEYFDMKPYCRHNFLSMQC